MEVGVGAGTCLVGVLGTNLVNQEWKRQAGPPPPRSLNLAVPTLPAASTHVDEHARNVRAERLTTWRAGDAHRAHGGLQRSAWRSGWLELLHHLLLVGPMDTLVVHHLAAVQLAARLGEGAAPRSTSCTGATMLQPCTHARRPPP